MMAGTWFLFLAMALPPCPVPQGTPAERAVQAREALVAAQNAFQKGDPATAAAAFHQAACLVPSNAHAFRGLGVSLAASGNLPGARDALERARQLAPRDASVLSSLAQVQASLSQFAEARRTLAAAEQLAPGSPQLSLLKLRILLAEDDKTGALETARALSQRYSRQADLHAKLGDLLARAGLHGEAAKELELSLDLAPANRDLWLALLRTRLAAGEADPLRTSLRKMSVAFPRDAALHAQAAPLLFERNHHDLALAEYLRARQLGHQSSEDSLRLATLANIAGAFDDAVRESLAVEQAANASDRMRAAAAAIAGISYDGLGKQKEAVEQLRHAIRLAPDLENGYLTLAEVYEKARAYDEAASVLAQGWKALPGSSAIGTRLGQIWLAAGQPQRAAGALAQVVEKFPTGAEAWALLARARAATGEPAEAVRAWRQVERLHPDYPMLPVMLAQALVAQNPPANAEALVQLRKAERLTPDDPEIYYLEGRIHVSEGRYSEAAASLERALRLRPDMANWYYQLGLAYQRLGKTAQAREQFDRMNHLRSQTGSAEPAGRTSPPE
ncbi:MAG: tetratricopeptide repeat protein [Bryobacteraceae bacterium]